MADERVTDIQGVEVGDAEKLWQIGEAETMAGIDLEAELVGLP